MLARRPFTQKPKPDRAPMEWPGRQAFAPAVRCDVVGRAQPKENAIQSEPYRRLVASYPCIHCQIQGYSQAAHPPPTGKGRKEDDRECFPLCCTRPGITGCHVEFDQYRLISTDQMREVAAAWGVRTRNQIIVDGLWPAGLERFHRTSEAQ